MKFKNFYVSVLIAGLMLGGLSLAQLHAQVQNPEDIVQALAREFIPAGILAKMKAGMDSKTPNTGIPFDIFYSLYLPAQQNMQGVFFFKAKNDALGFHGATPAAGEEEQEVSAFETTPTQLISMNNIYLFFKQLNGDYEKQIYVPFNQKADGMTYNAEDEPFYSVGYPLPPGDYVLSMAIVSAADQEKLGIQYYEFSLPNSTAFTGIEISPPFFINQMNQMSSVEMQPEIHKGFFTYSLYQMVPNIEHAFAPGADLDIFFYIFGVETTPEGKADIEINYSISAGEEIQIRYATTSYSFPVVSQPLPMKKTVIIKTTDEQGNESEKTETQDLEPGSYTFNIEIKDNLSGKTAIKSVEIEVR